MVGGDAPEEMIVACSQQHQMRALREEINKERKTLVKELYAFKLYEGIMLATQLETYST